MKALFHTDDGWPGLVLRLTLGLVMFPPVSSSAIWRYWLGFSPGSRPQVWPLSCWVPAPWCISPTGLS